MIYQFHLDAEIVRNGVVASMILLKNGLVYTMNDTPHVCDVLVDEGMIVNVGTDIPADGAQVYDLSGKLVFPGFIDAHCHIGLWEDGMGMEGADGNEATSPVTPSLLGIDGLNPFDPCFGEACRAGITTVVTGPGSANVIGGQFAALKTSGRTLDDMLIQSPIAMKAAVGENPKRVYSSKKTAPSTRMAIANVFRKAMIEAREYMKAKEAAAQDPDKKCEYKPDMEALLPVLRREERMKIHAHRADDILTALRLAREFDLDVSIEHCTEGHLIADIIKKEQEERGIGVIVGPLLSERSKIELRNLTYAAPRILDEAGVRFAIMTDHPVIPSQYLPIAAGLAVRDGLREEVALAAITKNAAEVVGLLSHLGTIEIGKDADIAVYQGHPFDTRSRCIMTLVNGKIAHMA